MTRGRYLALPLALALGGCPAPAVPPTVLPGESTVTMPAVPGQADPAKLLTPPTGSTRGFIAMAGGARLEGRVGLAFTDDAFFRENAAKFSVLATPAGTAIVTLGTLAEEIFTWKGEVATRLTGPDGSFEFETAPGDRPYVASAALAGGHRLSALILPTTNPAVLNEASTMITELARWQLRDQPERAGQKALSNLAPRTLGLINTLSRDFARAEDFVAEPGPRVPALVQGAGFVARNHYVERFGAGVTLVGKTAADQLSDAWREALGFRPLALVRVVGNGSKSGSSEDGEPATDVSLYSPFDAAPAADGTVYITTRAGLLRAVPATDRAKAFGWKTPMSAGAIYTIGGVFNGPDSLAAFNAGYAEAEAKSAADPAAAPAIDDPATALFGTQRVLVESTDAGDNLYLTTTEGGRVLFLPSSDIKGRYGRDFLANHLYTVAGTDRLLAKGANARGDDGKPAWQAPLSGPMGLAQNASHDLFVTDTGEGGDLRVVRASDGLRFTVGVTLDGATLSLAGARDIRFHDGQLTVTLPDRHVVVRFAAPEVAALPAAAPLAAQLVLGQLDQPGVLAADQPEPTIWDVSSGTLAANVRLDRPTSLDFDGLGGMFVADAGRIRYASKDGMVYTIAGGLATSFLGGDARLASFPDTRFLHRAADGNVLITDGDLDVVRRLVTARGSL